MPGDTNFPPQYSESCVSGTIGQLNDLSGPEEQTNPPVGPMGTTQSVKLNLSRNADLTPNGDYTPIPVVIAGTRPPFSNHFPGLRESMIASAIVQLAEQIPEDNAPLREAIIELAEKLHRAGAEKILRNRIVRSRPQKKKHKKI